MSAHKPHRFFLSHVDSPVDRLDVVTVEGAVCLIAFAPVDGEEYPEQWIARLFPDFELTRDQRANDFVHRELHEYFLGKRKRFAVKIRLEGTDFQLQVWTALRSIPFGETRSYKSVAMTVGNPSATRAVGAAVGRNPVPIIVPCHRVIGENGHLVGFGGGIERKKKLLQLEGALIV